VSNLVYRKCWSITQSAPLGDSCKLITKVLNRDFQVNTMTPLHIAQRLALRIIGRDHE
jgi:hypothetical protein